MKELNNDELVGLWPPLLSLAAFAVVTLCILVGTGLFIVIATFVYFDAVNPVGAVWGGLFLVIVFCFCNFKVTRGSVRAAQVLRWYSLFIACCALSAVFMVEQQEQLIMCLILLAAACLAFYLISGKRYQKYLSHQKEVLAMYQQAKKEVATVANMSDTKPRNK
ncbi:hypothetical protein [Thalassomonas actiniarum]|uniref:Uncharacterized protein n=1 Tax=Thalassomonas actiniarum TaxID=485447 RepID=A0AAF0C6K4_9GAMM|nr:hypothetical protein [Thalassomonas actiniarum]WDE02386.1 hypothetical protein SG35_028660 [Thalassomonas actiniarum]